MRQKLKRRTRSALQFPQSAVLVPADDIERRISSLRGHKVMIDADLAEVYGVGTRALNQAVRRNRHRFPHDFMIRLTRKETDSGRGGRRYLPNVFTEHGAVMLASVLNSAAAVAASIQVVRTFVRLRTILAAQEDLARKLDALEQKCERRFKAVFGTIREMLTPLATSRRPIGFLASRGKTRARSRG